MAKHDRITVVIRDAPPIVMVARGSGGSVAFRLEREWCTVEELNGAARPQVIREARVAIGSLVSVLRDRATDDPKHQAAKKKAPA